MPHASTRRRIAASALSLSVLVPVAQAASAPTASAASATTQVYRLYNKVNGDHFYTTSSGERDAITTQWGNVWTAEGVAFTLDPSVDTAPLYRFYNKVNGTHFYTTSAAERDNVIARWSATYSYEGVAFNVGTTQHTGETPVYRLYNSQSGGSHFYTTSATERDHAVSTWSTFSSEGTAFYATPVAQQAPSPKFASLTSQITTLMKDARITSANIGIKVVDEQTGTLIYQRNPDALLTLASNEKMLTDAAALTYLGSNYTFPTTLYVDGRSGSTVNNVYIKGSGDPSLTDADIAGFADALKNAGITKVSGSVIADATVFDDNRFNPGWQPYNFTSSDDSEVSGLTFAATETSTGVVRVNYTGTSGKPNVSIYPASAASYVTLTNQAGNGSSDTIEANRSSATSSNIIVTGKQPSGVSSYVVEPISDPARLVATMLRYHLGKRGIAVTGGVAKGAVPATATKVTTHNSASLISLLRVAIKNSNNTQVEQIAKATGAVYAGAQGSWTNAGAALKSVTTKAGAASSAFTVTDGSGEAYTTKGTVAGLNALQRYAVKQAWGDDWYSTLAVGAVDGTLKYRFVGTVAAGNVHAKTGTLSDLNTKVTSLSGFVTGADGRRYVFSTVSNYTGDTTKPVTDAMVVDIARYRAS